MTITAVSTPFLGNSMLPAINQADNQLTNLETEATTGQYANLGQHLGVSSGHELSLRSADDWLQSLTASNSLTAGRLTATSDALTSVVGAARTTLSTLVGWQPSTGSAAPIGATGDDSMQSLVGLANASYDNQYVFGGINSGVTPMSSFSTGSPAQTALVNAFQTQFGFAPTSSQAQNITSAQMTSFLSGPFANEFSTTNWTANWSSASSTDDSTQISPGQTVQTSTNLNAGGFQPLAQAYAMLSMFGNGQLSPSATQAVVSSATTLITQGLSQLTTVGASVGQMQSRVTQADDDMTAQISLMNKQIGSLDNVNVATVATQLSALTTQLETAYQLTAQLQKLSLAQYLPS